MPCPLRLLLLALVLLLPLDAAQWRPAGVPVSDEPVLAAFSLPDGRVLALHDGGASGITIPGSRRWTPGPTMTVPRRGFAATQLASGVVVVVGGRSRDDEARSLRSVEAFLPWTGAWFSAGDILLTGRAAPFVAVLPSGRILVAGGRRSITDPDAESPGQLLLTSSEIIDPATRLSTPAADLAQPHHDGRAVRLSGGDVLVVGGNAGSSGSWSGDAEVFRESLGAWLPVAGDIGPREGFALTALSGGGALVTGGSHVYAGLDLDAQRYVPAARAFVSAGMPRLQRTHHAAVALADGRVLLIGGDGPSGDLRRSEIWVPWTGRFVDSARLGDARTDPGAVRLRDGRVLAIGGAGFLAPRSSERFTADPAWYDALRSLAVPAPAPVAIAAG